jgi:hypothetical protein
MLLLAREVHADEPVRPRGTFTATMLVGWATLGDAYGAVDNLLGFGYGARVGYTFAWRVYFGALFVHHAGVNADPAAATVNRTYSGLELGYDLGPPGRSGLRPFLGAGIGSAQGFQVGCECGVVQLPGAPIYVDRHSTSYPVWVGVQAHLVQRPLFLAIDGQVGWFFGPVTDNPIAPAVFAEAGVVFD